MASTTTPPTSLPIPISRISPNLSRYFLYDSTAITYLRKEHHILGVLVGTLPQVPQQNVFLGVPLELQPEEVRLLVDKGVAYILDDIKWHKNAYVSMTAEKKNGYRNSLRKQGEQLARASTQAKEKRSEQVLQQTGIKKEASSASRMQEAEKDDALFAPPSPSQQPRPSSPTPSIVFINTPTPWLVTPSTSASLPTPPDSPANPELSPPSPPSYPLVAHLHSKDYYLSPGLRFGCQFLVYPGDPLRFHSHFLANCYDWDEEIELIDLVGGGRLGTGVKKGWLIGGEAEGSEERGQVQNTEHDPDEKTDTSGTREVRTFCIEWGGM